MKLIPTIILLLISALAWSQSPPPAWAQERFKLFADKYVLADYVQPQFLEADLSGDNRTDITFVIERRVDKRKGLLILFSDSDKSYVVGAGNDFGAAGKDFEWAHTWAIFKDKTTFETTFKANGDVAGQKEIKLDHAAIEIKEEEGAGGLIYFDGKKIVWIHQGD